MRWNLKLRRTAPGRIGLVVAAWALGVALIPSVSQAVEYVKICDPLLYGDEYHYLPGADICHNASTNDVRQETPAGTWRWRIPNNPITWVQAPRKICKGGRLIEFGTIDGTNLVINAHNRIEATTTPSLSLADREYVSSVIYRGDLTNGAPGEVCLFYHYVDMVDGSVYQPLGCASPTQNVRYPGLISFAPDIQPPDTTNPLFLVAASGRIASTPVPETIDGTLDIWLCIKKAKATP